MVPGLEVKSEPESDEACGSSPPLELRRPSSNEAVARAGGTVAHSLQSPHDCTTDSPQVATVYVHAALRIFHYKPPQQPPLRYYEPGAEPPPAHLRTPRHHHPLPGTEAPTTQPRLQVATPLHASRVLMLLQRYPIMWQGLLALKNYQAAVQMHFVFGNPHIASESLPCNLDGSTPPWRIAQRMRLEQTRVEDFARKMQIENEHCMLLALPCGRDHMDVLQQSNNLQTGFITYLQQKQAAGIVQIAAPGSQQAAYVVHIFPSCDFANENLARIAPDLLHRVADIAHLLIIIATV